VKSNRVAITISLSLLLLWVTGCNDSIDVGTTTNTASPCGNASITVTPPSTRPAMTGTVTSPSFLTFTSTTTGGSITGSPSGNDFGDFDVVASGTYAGVSDTWTAKGTLTVSAPTLQGHTPAIVMLVASAGQPTGTVTETVAPACNYKITLKTNDDKIQLPNPPQFVTAKATGGGTFSITTTSTTERSFTVSETLSPNGKNTQDLTSDVSGKVR
jgi:hypothetical protein